MKLKECHLKIIKADERCGTDIETIRKGIGDTPWLCGIGA
jgi:hypothetical protein